MSPVPLAKIDIMSDAAVTIMIPFRNPALRYVKIHAKLIQHAKPSPTGSYPARGPDGAVCIPRGATNPSAALASP